MIITPIILINYLFVDTIFTHEDKTKKVFNFFAITVGFTCLFEWLAFYIYVKDNLLQIMSFPALMILVNVIESFIKISVRNQAGSIFPFGMGIAINMYHGICIFSMPFSFLNLVPLLVFVIAMYVIRFIFCALYNNSKKGLKLVLIILVIAFLISILAFAWHDYSVNDAYKRDWRQLYYVAVYASFFLAFIMHYIPKVCYGHDKSINNIKKIRNINLTIHSILLIIIPLLCIFAVHGIILIILNGVILMSSYFFALYKPFTIDEKESNCWVIVAFLFTILTFFYMAADPILYLNASKYISQIWPFFLVVSGAIPSVSFFVSLLLKPQDEKVFEFIFNIIKGIKSSSVDIISQIIVGGISFFILVIFAIVYKTKEYAYEASNLFDVGLIEPRLEGFGGLNISSWCMIPILLNVITCFISLVIMAFRKKGKEESDVNQS